MVVPRRLELVTDYPITRSKLVRVGVCDYVPTIAVLDKKTVVYMDTEEWKFVAAQIPRMLTLLENRRKKVDADERVRCKNVLCLYSTSGRNRVMKIEQVFHCFSMFNQSPSTLESVSACFNRIETTKLRTNIKKINDSLDLITKMVDLYKKNEECQLVEPLDCVPIDFGINTNTLFYNLKELNDICNNNN